MFLLIDIGCLHCEKESQIVGMFSEEQKANDIAKYLKENHNYYDEKLHDYVVFPIIERDYINKKYEKMCKLKE